MSEQLSLSFPSPFVPPQSPERPDGSTPLDRPSDVVEGRARMPGRELAFERATQLARLLSANLKRPVKLFVTDNRSTMVSFDARGRALQIRVHHMFLDAPADVARALADYAGRGKRRAGRLIDAYVKRRSASIRKAKPHERIERFLESAGQHHDLLRLYADLNARFFDGRVEARIGWGLFTRRKRRRSIRMGVYDHDARAIRIHPALDRPEVPEFFVAYIVFHEMLHQMIPSKTHRGRQQHHSVEFRRRERAYPEYARAIAWEKTHLSLLLQPLTKITPSLSVS